MDVRREDLVRSDYRRAVRHEYYSGALLLLIGLIVFFQSIRYGTGDLRHMGAGYFPAILAVVLVLIGVTVSLTATYQNSSLAPDASADKPHKAPDVRGCCCILGGIIAFVILGRWGGLLPATFAITFIAAMGDRNNTVKSALLLTGLICAISVTVFWWALQLQFPLFAWGAA